MTEPSDNYEPTEVDLDLVVEEATGKPVKPANVTAGIVSMRQRITQLEAEKASLLDRLGTAAGESEEALNKHLAAINKVLATARERLAHYEAQLGAQN
jgi:hypothetical protein